MADVARTQAGELILIEINDGGTSGIPLSLHPIEFYSAVAEAEEDGDKEREDLFDEDEY